MKPRYFVYELWARNGGIVVPDTPRLVVGLDAARQACRDLTEKHAGDPDFLAAYYQLVGEDVCKLSITPKPLAKRVTAAATAFLTAFLIHGIIAASLPAIYGQWILGGGFAASWFCAQEAWWEK